MWRFELDARKHAFLGLSRAWTRVALVTLVTLVAWKSGHWHGLLRGVLQVVQPLRAGSRSPFWMRNRKLSLLVSEGYEPNALAVSDDSLKTPSEAEVKTEDGGPRAAGPEEPPQSYGPPATEEKLPKRDAWAAETVRKMAKETAGVGKRSSK